MNVEEVRISLQYFGWTDYMVFIFMLAICVLIGLYFAIQMRSKSKLHPGGKYAEADYLVGGRTMKLFPITMSLISR